MFDLEKSLAAWRHYLKHNRTFSKDDLDELEQHLRDEIAARVANGEQEKQAFNRAMQEMGDHGSAEEEYGKVFWRKAKQKRQLYSELKWRAAVLKNYFKIALRMLKKHKGYAFINISGLAVGLTSFLLISIFVQHELSYDQFYENADQIYRVVKKEPAEFFLNSNLFAVTPAPLAEALVREFPEIHAATTVKTDDALLSIEDQHFLEKGLSADSNFFSVFSLSLIQGNVQSALVAPKSIVLTATLAEKIFVQEEPLGKTLLYKNNEVFTVTGVISDPPKNGSLQYTYIIAISSKPRYQSYLQNNRWNNSSWYTFFLLKNQTSASALQAKMPGLLDKYFPQDNIDPAERTQLLIEPLKDVHLFSSVNFDFGIPGNIKNVYLFLLIACIVLLLACINYANLSVSQSLKRTREVGVRKALGAKQNQLTFQFLSESLLITFLALTIAIGLTYLLLPFFGQVIARPLQMGISEITFLLPVLIALLLLVGLLSGSYPALILSSLQPICILKGKAFATNPRNRFQRTLIVIQFGVTIVLLTCGYVIYEQLRFINTKETGYDREHVITIQVNDDALRKNYERIREQLLRNTNVHAVTYSGSLPVDVRSQDEISGWEGSNEEDRLRIYQMGAGYDVLDVFGINLVAGRTLSRNLSSDKEDGYLINETAAQALGWTPQEAIGKNLRQDNSATVVGVVKDFHMHSMHLAIKPLMIHYNTTSLEYISARVQPENLQTTLTSIENAVRQFSPYPFQYQFLDDSFDQLYKKEQRLGKVFGSFTILALFIASLGLFGLAAFTTKQRTKEIGVRKVLGASAGNIVMMLSKDFGILIFVASIIAAPIAYFAIQNWLESFSYHFHIGPGIFVLTTCFTLIIAIATVSYQTIRAATANPVTSLSHE